jgi:hypothetical protein
MLKTWMPHLTEENFAWIAAHPSETYVLSVDVESLGPSVPLHTTNAIGIFFAPRDWRTNESGLKLKKRWNLQGFFGQTSDPDTMSGFWDKHPAVFATLSENPLDPFEVMPDLIELVQALENVVGANNIVLVTDYPNYDLGRMDALIERTATSVWPFCYFGHDGNGKARHETIDPSERMAQLGPRAYDNAKKWFAENNVHVAHTHLPDDDAENTYWDLMYCDSVLQ